MACAECGSRAQGRRCRDCERDDYFADRLEQALDTIASETVTLSGPNRVQFEDACEDPAYRDEGGVE